MSDAVEAVGEDVEEETADELIGCQCHDFRPVASFGAIVLPREGDAAVVEGDEAAVRDGDPVGVAGEVNKDSLGSGEWFFGVDHPS